MGLFAALAGALFGRPEDPTERDLLDHVRHEHPQIRQPWPDDNPWTAHRGDHHDWIYDHHHQRGW